MKHKALTLEQAVERITCGVTPLGTEEVAPGEAGTRPLAAGRLPASSAQSISSRVNTRSKLWSHSSRIRVVPSGLRKSS